MADESGSPALPAAFAKASSPPAGRVPKAAGETPTPATPAADETATNAATDGDTKKPGAPKQPGLKSKGVPKQRLMWATLPTAGGVAGVGMYSGNAMVALVAIGLAAVVCGGAFAMHMIRKSGGGAGRSVAGAGLSRRGSGGGMPGQRRGLGRFFPGGRGRGGGMTGGRSAAGSPGRRAGGGQPGGLGRATAGRKPLGGGSGGPAGRGTAGGVGGPGASGSKATTGTAQRRGGRLNPMNWGRGQAGTSTAHGSIGGGTRRPTAGSGAAGSRTPSSGRTGSRLNPMNWRRTSSGGSGSGRPGAAGSGGGTGRSRGASTNSASGSSPGRGSSGLRRLLPSRGSGSSKPGARRGATTPKSAQPRVDKTSTCGPTPAGNRWWNRRNQPGPSAAGAGRPESKRQRDRRQAAPQTQVKPSRWTRVRGWWRGRHDQAASSLSTTTATASEAPPTPQPTPRPRWAGRRARRRQRAAKVPPTRASTPAEARDIGAQEQGSRVGWRGHRPLGRTARRKRRAAAAPPADEVAAKRAERAAVDKWLDEHPVDDAGFPLVTRPGPRLLPRAAVTDPMDDLAVRVRAVGMSTSAKERQMAVDTAKYTAMVDTSTPATLRNTLAAAGDTATRDATDLDEQANDLKSKAGDLDGMKGMAEAVEGLQREAAALAETAEGRRGIAAGFHAQAAGIAG